MKEVWQTTNQQPWVEALAAGLITIKTRTSEPVVPVGAPVLLHASKSRLWPHWRRLRWMSQIRSCDRGVVAAVAIVEATGRTEDLMKPDEYPFWDVLDVEGCRVEWNCAAEFAVRFSQVTRLKVPVAATGMQAPFARAKSDVVQAVLHSNPGVRQILA